MIAVRLQGRLGNQLFQYAFIIVAAKKLNTRFYIDQFIEPSIIDKYFENVTGINKATRQVFNINGFKNIFNFHLRRLYFKYLPKINKLSVKEYTFTDTVLETTLSNNTLYSGFFQSELFFKDAEDLIRNKFSLKKIVTGQFKNKYGGLYRDNRIVTIHIRRTDYQYLPHLNLGGDDLSLPISYYQKALAKYEGQNVHFVFVTDDFDFVSQSFKYIENKTISNDTEIMDFQHLLNADECIISNSSFSWWGAWLNPKQNKVVYCPEYYVGFHLKQQIPKNIYPKEWRQIEFS